MFKELDANALLSALTESVKIEVSRRGKTYNERPDTAATLKSVVKWMSTQDARPGLILCGPNPGNGKTTIAQALFDFLRTYPGKLRSEYNEREKEILREYSTRFDAIQPLWNTRWGFSERNAWIADNPDLYAQIEAVYADREEAFIQAGRERIKELSSVPQPRQFYSAQYLADIAARNEWYEILPEILSEKILFVDDIGTEPLRVFAKAAEVRPVEELIYKCYNSLTPLVLTTNLALKDISAHYGERVADRLREMCEIVTFKGKSFR